MKIQSIIPLILATVLMACCQEGKTPTTKEVDASQTSTEATDKKQTASKPTKKANPELHPVTALVGGTIFDGTGAKPIEDGVVILEKDKIKAVGKSGDIQVPPNAHVLDAKGKWIIPGLIDTHIHFFQSGGVYTRPDIADLRETFSYELEQTAIRKDMEDSLSRMLVSGLTSVVDMGGPFWNYDVREKSKELLLSPRVAVAGPLISTVPRPQLDLGDPPIIEASSPDHARELVRKQLEKGTDLIKVWFIVAKDKGPDATLSMLEAVVDESHKGKTRVAVHATELTSAKAAVKAGADILVHSVDDAPVDGELISMMKERDVILIPTLVVYEGYGQVLTGEAVPTDFERRYGDPRALRSFRELTQIQDSPPEQALSRKERLAAKAPVMAANLVALQKAGITIAAGTDAGNVGTLHGASYHRELALMAEAGLSNEEILISATKNAARVFADKPLMGTLEPGKLADILILNDSPIEDLATLKTPARIVKGGVVLTPNEIHPSNPAWVVQGQLDAYNKRDLDAFLSFFDENVSITRMPSGESLAKGTGEMRETYSSMFKKSPDLHCNLTSRIVSGDWVIDHELVTGIAGRPFVRAVAMYRVEDGLIKEVRFLPTQTFTAQVD